MTGTLVLGHPFHSRSLQHHNSAEMALTNFQSKPISHKVEAPKGAKIRLFAWEGLIPFSALTILLRNL
jgi:hypothetical protein